MKTAVKLKDIASYSKGSQINGNNLIENGTYEYLNGGINPSGKWNEYNVDGNTITISEGGNSCGYVNYMINPFWCGAHCYYLYDLKCPSKYLYYALKGNQSSIMKLRSGACMPNIKKKDLGEFVLSIDLDKNEQDRAIAIFNCLSSIITHRRTQLEKLDLLVKARFVEMFGEPITNSKSLETKNLKDVMVLKAGDFTAASDISSEPTDKNIYPCFGGNGIRGYVSEYNQDGDFSLIGRQGALSGNVQYARGKFKNTEHALLVTPTIEMNSIWLNQLLLNLDLKRYQTGAAQPGLSVKNLQEIPIIQVEIPEQTQFADFVKQVDKSKVAVQKELDKAQMLFDSLMQEYFG